MKGVFFLFALLFSVAASAQQLTVALTTSTSKETRLDVSASIEVGFQRANQYYVTELPTAAFEPHFKWLKKYISYLVMDAKNFSYMVLVAKGRPQALLDIPSLEKDGEDIMIFPITNQDGKSIIYLPEGRTMEIHRGQR